MNCPICGKTKWAETMIGAVERCLNCGALVGICYRGQVSGLVDFRFADFPVKHEDQRYFDLRIVGSAGLECVHGWFDVNTKRLVQVG